MNGDSAVGNAAQQSLQNTIGSLIAPIDVAGTIASVLASVLGGNSNATGGSNASGRVLFGGVNYGNGNVAGGNGSDNQTGANGSDANSVGIGPGAGATSGASGGSNSGGTVGFGGVNFGTGDVLGGVSLNTQQQANLARLNALGVSIPALRAQVTPTNLTGQQENAAIKTPAIKTEHIVIGAGLAGILLLVFLA